MKVILLKDVRGVGSVRDIKDVADGYAINFLFPRKFAEPATEEKVRQMERHKEAHEADLQKAEEDLTKKVQSLNGKTVAIQSRATEKGGLFKAVGTGDVARAIREQHSLEIPEAAVSVREPIKTVGEHMVELHSKSVQANFGVVVTAA